MKKDYLCVFSGNHVNTLNIIDSLNKINIYPIIKNESESARLAGFGIISEKKNIYVHRDEYVKANELIKSILH
ncbi:MAG: DUF2007 domain-containing protein [Flavobacteriaceae bacterium]|nr:hypothetical protein [Flavobacteriaceae bacterium]|tara:strand:- start:6855 stop:7073 length:219 start_codon:yes stop_codon:yes gene_type:complete